MWQISALGLCWLLIPSFGSVRGCRQPLIGLRTHPRFQVWVPSRGFGVCAHPGAFFLCTQVAGRLIRACTHLGCQVWAPGHSLGYVPTGALWAWHPGSGLLIRARVHRKFQLWAPSLLIWVGTSWASGERWACFSAFTVQGLRGEGRQRPRLPGRVL